MIEVMPNSKVLLKTAFPGLTTADIDLLDQAARPCSFEEGTDICQEGEEGDCLYLIGQGRVDIIVHAGNGQEIFVDTIGEGAYFGEMALLGQTTRSATIRAHTDCYMLEISHDKFEAVVISNPGLLRRLLHRIIGHLRRNDRAVIQELNATNAELVKAYEELAEQEALRSKFIATLTHEIRTPLTKMRGYLDLMNKGAVNEQMLPVAMGNISRNVEHMVGLTNDMFLLYEMNPTKLTYSQIDLGELLIEALQITRQNMSDITTPVHFNISPDVTTLRADHKTLLLAIRAILGNAFKYDPTNSPVNIDVSGNEAEVCIAIQDKGIGIPLHEQSRIFDPFYRIEEEGGAHLFPGIGVGLTIAQFVVKRHKGRIQIQSQPDQGSTFTIILPRT